MAVAAPSGSATGRPKIGHGCDRPALPFSGLWPKGDGEVHVGTMHRFKGLEYQRLAIVGARDGVIPRTAVIERYRATDPRRCAREELRARSLLFVAATRARDTLRISWHDRPSPYLPV